MKLVNPFIYDLDGENVPKVTTETQKLNQQVENEKKVEKKTTPIKKPNFWQRIKKELQSWSNKDANDSAFDDTQV